LLLHAAVFSVAPFAEVMCNDAGYDRNDEVLEHLLITLLPVPELPSEGAAI
jgi:hypothetical protein